MTATHDHGQYYTLTFHGRPGDRSAPVLVWDKHRGWLYPGSGARAYPDGLPDGAVVERLYRASECAATVVDLKIHQAIHDANEIDPIDPPADFAFDYAKYVQGGAT